MDMTETARDKTIVTESISVTASSKTVCLQCDVKYSDIHFYALENRFVVHVAKVDNTNEAFDADSNPYLH